MSGKPAARMTDLIKCVLKCPLPGLPPHTPPPGLPIMPPCAANVLIGGLPAARLGDWALHVTPIPLPNNIISAAFPVVIKNQPAARKSDPGACPGSKIASACCTSCEIGLSGTTGNPDVGQSVCASMAIGRNPPAGSTRPNGTPLQSGTPRQSYNNCGVESSRQILQQRNGTNPGQEALLNTATGNGWASQPAIGSQVSGGNG